MRDQLAFLATYVADWPGDSEVVGGPLWLAEVRSIVCDTFEDARAWGLAWSASGKACVVQTLRLEVTPLPPVGKGKFLGGWNVVTAHLCTPDRVELLPNKLRWDLSLLIGAR